MKRTHSAPSGFIIAILAIVVLWRAIYAYWTPVVNNIPVPPGDDVAFHMERVAANLAGDYHLFYREYPLGYHWFIATVARLLGLDAVTALTYLSPLLLVLPILPIFLLGKRLFSPQAGLIAVLAWVGLAHSPLFAYGDGSQANVFGATFLLPLAVYAVFAATERTNPKTIAWALAACAIIPFVHHLSVLFTLAALAPLLLYRLWQSFATASTPTKRRLVLSILLLSGVCLAFWLWTPYGDSLRRIERLAFGGVPNIDTILTIHHAWFFYLGLIGIAAISLSRSIRVEVKLLVAGWFLAIWAIGHSAITPFPERFLRELTIPLALGAGYLGALLAARLPGRTGLPVVTLALLVLCGWRFSVHYGHSFGFPEPFGYIARVRPETLETIGFIRRTQDPRAHIIANNGNFFLPLLLENPVDVAQDPSGLFRSIRSVKPELLYVGPLPPHVAEATGPQHFHHYSEITQILREMPGYSRIYTGTDGTELYARTSELAS